MDYINKCLTDLVFAREALAIETENTPDLNRALDLLDDVIYDIEDYIRRK
jgi:hypothetical protein